MSNKHVSMAEKQIHDGSPSLQSRVDETFGGGETDPDGQELPARNSSASQSRQRNRMPGEFWRKLLHMSPGLLPFTIGFVPHPERLDWISQAVVTGLCVGLTLVFLSLHRVVHRPGETNLLSTTLSYPATVIAAVLLFPEHVELTGVVVVVLAFGDGSAYIGGKLFGKRALPWNGEKTWFGTLSFVAVSAPLSALAYWILADGAGRDVGVAIACGTAAALAGAIAESLPVKLTDNLRVGVAALLTVSLVQSATVGLTVF